MRTRTPWRPSSLVMAARCERLCQKSRAAVSSVRVVGRDRVIDRGACAPGREHGGGDDEHGAMAHGCSSIQNESVRPTKTKWRVSAAVMASPPKKTP
ncbi:MAG: hypothetical protein R3B46_00935 [Phycisphaerales bacterium]